MFAEGKRSSLLTVVFAMIWVFAGAGGLFAAEGGTRTIVDATGREVRVPDRPQRIAIGTTVLPNMVYALQGHARNIVAINPASYAGWQIGTFRFLAPELENVNTSMINNDFSLNVEALAEADVDLVLNWDSQMDSAKQLEAIGIPCVLFRSATDLASLKELLALLGDVLNCRERAEEGLAWYNETEAYFKGKEASVAVLAEEDRPKVLHFQRASKFQVYGGGMNHYVTEIEGGRNFKLPVDRAAPTMEDVLVFNPDIIFISNFDDVTPQDFYENRLDGQDWSGISAVKNRRVYKVPAGLYRWAPPNSFEKPLYMKWTATIVQPKLFSDIDIRKEIRDFYASYYKYNLTEEQIDTILRVRLNEQSR